MNLFRVLAALMSICISGAAFAQATVQTELIKYNDNFITRLVASDTTWVEDPETEEYKVIITHRSGIQSLNNLNVYAEDEAGQPKVPATLEDSESFIRNLLADELNILERYSFKEFSAEMIIDEKGRFAYFEPNKDIYFKGNRTTVCDVLDCMEQKLQNTLFIPAISDGDTVPYFINFKHSKPDVSVVY